MTCHVPTTGKKKWVVVIDAGHGGKDPGCHGTKYKEKNVALAVALKLGQYLEANDKEVKVIYTRKEDVFIPLNERADIANRNHADFFICIHCNASPDKSAFGSATYVMGLYKSEGNLEVSKRENQAVLYEKDYKQTYNGFDPNSDEATILFAMYQNMYLKQSLDLSSKIQREYATRAKRTDDGVKQAGFLVLWKTAMPSLLTEIGFLTNPAEEAYIGSTKGQEAIANCIFLAFQQYKSEVDGSAYTPDSYNDGGGTETESNDTVNTESQSVDSLIHAQTVEQDSGKVVYKVQIATANQPYPMDDKRFKDLPDVEVYFDKTIYKYTSGHFYTREDAIKLQNTLKIKGYPDAFIIEFKGSKRMDTPDGR